MPPTTDDTETLPFAAQRTPPWELPEATKFSKYDPEGGLLSDVRLLEAMPEFCAQFIEATTTKHDDGRPRLQGDWGKVMLAFANSGWVKVSTFWRNAGGGDLEGMWLRGAALKADDVSAPRRA